MAVEAHEIGRASNKMITGRPRQLKAQGLVTRTVNDTAPVTVTYDINAFGRSALDGDRTRRLWIAFPGPAPSRAKARRGAVATK